MIHIYMYFSYICVVAQNRLSRPFTLLVEEDQAPWLDWWPSSSLS